MPVLIDSGPLGTRLFTTTGKLEGMNCPEFRSSDPHCIDLGLVNNMPDLALEQTERQIVRLLDAAASNLLVRLTYYSLPDLPRGEWGQRHLKRLHYHNIADLWERKIDGLIITGAEPRTPDLRMEPYWDTLTELFDWAEQNTISTVTSCLAVHAAVLHFDGIDRHALGHKCFGVFEFDRATQDHLLDGIPPSVLMPHSRWNEIREDALKSAGYDILMRSAHSGVDMFAKRKKSLFIFFQGHPEYEAWTLFGEYRRDVLRFLSGEQAIYPEIPEGYFDQGSARILGTFRAHALTNRDEKLMATFPSDQLVGKLADGWRSTATKTYANWLQQVVSSKRERAKSIPSFVNLPVGLEE